MRYAYMDDTDGDQTALNLDALGGLAKDELGPRPPGVKPLGSVALYCQRLVADGVICYGILHHGTDMLGRLVTICSRTSCGHRAIVPRVRMVAGVKRCGKCHRVIDGDNAFHSETRDPACKHCNDQRKARQRERDRLRTKRSAA